MAVNVDPRLVRLSARARHSRETEATIREELEAKVRDTLSKMKYDLDMAIIDLLNAGVRVTSIARAVTRPGLTPNRAYVYRVRDQYSDLLRAPGDEVYPFRWEPRTIRLGGMERKVYDLVADFNGFGPDKIYGKYRWSFVGGQPEPLYSESDDEFSTGVPFPEGAAYEQVLAEWLSMNPQPQSDGPGEEEGAAYWPL